jgi:hypothetical protein
MYLEQALPVLFPMEFEVAIFGRVSAHELNKNNIDNIPKIFIYPPIGLFLSSLEGYRENLN